MDYSQPKMVVVQNKNYTFQKFNADVGLSVFVRLAKIVAEPMARAIELKGKDENSPEFAQAMQEMVRALVQRLDEKEAKILVADLMSEVFPDGQTYALGTYGNADGGNWKVYFKGNLTGLFHVVYQSVMENFEDFLSALKLVGGSQLASFTAKQKSPGPTT